ncbi:unnamed protein product [Ascophyllum nodosum]
MGDVAAESALSDKPLADTETKEQAIDDTEQAGQVNDGTTAAAITSVTTNDENELPLVPQDSNGAPCAGGAEERYGPGASWPHHEGNVSDGAMKNESGQDRGLDDIHDDMYRRLLELVLQMINEARENRDRNPLILDTALEVPAMTHSRAMCEHGFLSHWDIGGRKPYQRYADFASGQHVSEVIFGSDMEEEDETQILNKIKHWIHERAGAEVVDDNNKVESDSNHLLDIYHTHIAIGMCIDNGQLRYVEVYANRYLELHNAPLELSVSEDSSVFQVSVQKSKADVGPYACLVFHDPAATPLTVGELQQQFTGAYCDFMPSQVAVVWPWQMKVLEGGVFDIPVSVSSVKAGTYYVQILVRSDPESIPYHEDPSGGLPLPGDSFCGAALVITAPENPTTSLGLSGLDEENDFFVETYGNSLEEREARRMASMTATRRDLAPIVNIRVVKATGRNNIEQRDNFETTVLMPPERTEDTAQPNLAIAFLRLGSWEDYSLVRKTSLAPPCAGITPLLPQQQRSRSNSDHSRGGETKGEKNEVALEALSPDDTTAGVAVADTFDSDGNNGAEVGDPMATSAPSGGEVIDVAGEEQPEDHREKSPQNGKIEETAGEEIVAPAQDELGEGGMEALPRPPLVLTEIFLVTFKEGRKVRDDTISTHRQVEVPEGCQLVPGDLADPSVSGGDQGSEKISGEEQDMQQEGQAGDGCNPIDEEKDECELQRRDAVYLGVVNELYGSTIHLCYKKAGASLPVIQQVTDRTSERTAKQARSYAVYRQIPQHLGIDGNDDGREDVVDSIQDQAYEVDTSMTAEQVLEWEKKQNQEAIKDEDMREQAERERKQREASEAIRNRIEEALKEKADLVKENVNWQKKISVLMFWQQKTREDTRDARVEPGDGKGPGLEKDLEATAVRENEKQYAESLTSIASCRQRLKEMQAEFDTVAIRLQTQLDEKEYKSREIGDSFRDFKREIARTAVHGHTGRSIPKKVIVQFETAENRKEEEIEKVRLKNISLRMMLRKAERKLRAKEQLAEGLHVIDFEQLKIENQSVIEKIEERDDELVKLKKKNTASVQVLTHIKEKLQFVAAENDVTSHQLSALERDLNQEKDALTRAKKDRESLRREVARLRQSQEFANSDLLMQDFEHRKSQVKKLPHKLEELRSKHRLLLLEQERLERLRESNKMIQPTDDNLGNTEHFYKL